MKSHKKVTKKSQKTDVTLTKNMALILEIIKINPYILTNDIADRLNIKRETVSRNLSKLKKIGLITRVGKTKGGYWESTK